MKQQTFTVEDLDKNYRFNGPQDDRHQGMAIKRVLFRDDGVLVVLEPDNSFRRDMWRLDRDDIEMVLRNRIWKMWGWHPKSVKFSWVDENPGAERRAPEEMIHIRRATRRVTLAAILSEEHVHA